MCPQVVHPRRSVKLTRCTPNDSCRGTADSVMFGNQSYPHCPFLFVQPFRPIKAHIQLCSHARPHPNTHAERLSLVRHIFLRSLLSSIPSFPWESALRFV
ncbi:unnamed protein product [Hymenolepis diminuta]|uniref:Uncharacterized protein n=1 Tax=Hymenolepis diminuta TaxID=6216 RepID=A0A564Z9A8_HYMDI|nr:unnamed protein product [Hymenolepis diminuta]